MDEKDIVLIIIIIIWLIGVFITFILNEKIIGISIEGISIGMTFMYIWQYRIKKSLGG